MNKISLLVSVLFVPLVSSVTWAQSCDNNKAVEIESTTASAGKWANVRNSAGSLRFESDRLLTEGYGLLTSADPAKKISSLMLTSVPTKFLTDYPDKDYCAAKLSATSAKPLTFSNLKFNSVKELTSWFGDFSQGSGTEGEKMYTECDKACSPQFKIDVTESGGKINGTAFVTCGHARDKADDTYKLKILSGGC